jgi:hypothetical protein
VQVEVAQLGRRCGFADITIGERGAPNTAAGFQLIDQKYATTKLQGVLIVKVGAQTINMLISWENLHELLE